jgi:hypothetical protein
MVFEKNQITKSQFSVLVLFISLVVFSPFSLAQKKKVVKDSGQKAKVTVDGAAVYEAPNFDSPVMDYMDRGKSILVSRRVYRGAGGLGAFHKVRLRKGVFGFITDVDIQTSGKALPSSRAVKPTSENQQPVEEQRAAVDSNDPTQIQPELEREEPEEVRMNGAGIYLTRYLSLNYATFDYAEKIAKQTNSADLAMLGVKLTGPGSVMGGLPIDFEMNISTAEPDFYSKYYKSTKGFMFLGHAMVMLQGPEFKKSAIYYGGGLALKYTRFEVITNKFPNSSAIDSQDLVVGLAAQIGYAHEIGSKYLLKGDLRYYYEKEAYMGYALSFGTKF